MSLDKELLAVYSAIKQFQHAVQSRLFVVYTDYNRIDSKNEYPQSYNETTSESFDTDSEDERFRRLHRKRKRIQVFSSSENECDQDIEISIDGRKITIAQHFQRSVRHMRNDIS